MQDLITGRQLYVLKCSGCHSLHRPDELSVQQWEKTVPEMMTRAKLTKEEAQLIVRYLVTVLETKERAPSENASASKSDNDQ
jgi:cytochrome c1